MECASRESGCTRSVLTPRPCPHLHFHVEPHFQHRSSAASAAPSAAHVGDGEERIVQLPAAGKDDASGSLVPVDRGNRDAGISAVRAASEVIHQGINMTIYVEGKRSFDGKLLPFKKGPFYLAEETAVPVVPVTIVGTHYVMPKGRFSIKPG